MLADSIADSAAPGGSSCAGPQRHHRRDRRRQDPARPGHRPALGQKGGDEPGAPGAPSRRWCRRSSRTAARRWRWPVSCRAAAARGPAWTACSVSAAAVEDGAARAPRLLRAARARPAAAARASARPARRRGGRPSSSRCRPPTARPSTTRAGLSRELERLRGAGRDREREVDMLRFQVGEIEAAAPSPAKTSGWRASASACATPASSSSASAAPWRCWPANQTAAALDAVRVAAAPARPRRRPQTRRSPRGRAPRPAWPPSGRRR